MPEFDEILKELKQRRDELRVRIHLASRELQDEWEELDGKMNDFSRRAGLRETGDGVGKALGSLGTELKAGYQRIHRALKDE
jgi:hypothetical protein